MYLSTFVYNLMSWFFQSMIIYLDCYVKDLHNHKKKNEISFNRVCELTPMTTLRKPIVPAGSDGKL